MSVVRDEATTVSREQRQRFERDGYLVIDGTGSPESRLDAIVADLDGKYAFPYHREADGVYYSGDRIMDAWKISANVRDLALSPVVSTILEQLYGRKPLPFQTLNFWVGTQQATHSDTYHFSCLPPGYMCGVWVALEDIGPDCGPLVYYPGSHRLPELTAEDLGPDADEAEYTQYVADLVEREGFEPHYATIRKGQAFIWAANLLHGGSPRKDAILTRHSQVTHFYFEGCKYYVPRYTKGDQVYRRYPEWVTRDPDREVRFIRDVVADTTPEGAVVAVVSNNDDRLLELSGRRAWHFPQDESGTWSDHPADGDEAIAQVEELRAKGAGYLVFPESALWGAEGYSKLRGYLGAKYSSVVYEDHCLILALCEPLAAG